MKKEATSDCSVATGNNNNGIARSSKDTFEPLRVLIIAITSFRIY